MRFHLLAIALFAIVAGSGSSAQAQGAAAGLRGKSVIASWTEIRVQRLGGIGEFTERAVANSLSAYISAEGRVFARRTVFSSGSKRRGSGSQSSVGENAGGRQQASIQGRSLVIITNFRAGGARMARIDFDAGFSSCTANVILGRENGTAVVHGRSQIGGQALEIKSAKVTNPTCSIRSGNVFGQ